MPRPRLVLWDIDGTLVRGRGQRVAVDVFMRAFRATFGLPEDLPYPLDSAGKTDPLIARELLEAQALAHDPALLERCMEVYARGMEDARERLGQDLRVLPGVAELLRGLHARGVWQSLLTGNLLPVARLKLGLVGLDQHLDFDVGAFGSDHHDRNCLVPIALERLRTLRGVAVAPEEVLVVGDTPRDVACARAGGAAVLAVATGGHTLEELRVAGADAVLADLADTAAALHTVEALSASLVRERRA